MLTDIHFHFKPADGDSPAFFSWKIVVDGTRYARFYEYPKMIELDHEVVYAQAFADIKKAYPKILEMIKAFRD